MWDVKEGADGSASDGGIQEVSKEGATGVKGSHGGMAKGTLRVLARGVDDV